MRCCKAFLTATLVVIGLVSVYVLGLRPAGFITSYYSPLYSTHIYSLHGNARLTQEFIANYPGLSRIDLYFQPHSAAARLTVRLKTSCASAEDIEIFSPELREHPQARPYAFTFTPIDDSTARRFCLVLENQAAGTDASIGVYASNGDVYLDGEAKYRLNTLDVKQGKIDYEIFFGFPLVLKSGEPLDPAFDIAFKLHYAGEVGGTMQALLARLSAQKPSLLGYSEFYVFLGVSYVALLWLLFRLILQTKTGSKL